MKNPFQNTQIGRTRGSLSIKCEDVRALELELSNQRKVFWIICDARKWGSAVCKNILMLQGGNLKKHTQCHSLVNLKPRAIFLYAGSYLYSHHGLRKRKSIHRINFLSSQREYDFRSKLVFSQRLQHRIVRKHDMSVHGIQEP